MCGICGVLGNSLSYTEKRLFQNLLFFNQTRGEHSTGVLGLQRANGSLEAPIIPSIAKDAVPSSAALLNRDSDIRKETEKSLLTGLIGHCRHATVGKINAENAHPFEIGNIIGVHNGTIKKAFKGSTNYETDSQALYALIDSEGVEAALNEVECAYSTNCAYALAWYDKRDGKVRFIRNDERPLWFTYVYGALDLVFASERWMLNSAVEAAKVNLKMNTHTLLQEKTDMFTLTKHRLFTVDPIHPGNYTIEEVKVKPVTFQSYTSGHAYKYKENGQSHRIHPYGWSGLDDWEAYEDLVEDKKGTSSGSGIDWLSRLQEEDEKTEKKKSGTKTEKRGNSYVPGANGNLIPLEVFLHRCQEGCCNCREEVTDPPEEALWFDNNNMVCRSCYEANDWIQAYFLSKEATEESESDCC